MWLVPSETILSQTYENLSDTSHPYRQKLDNDFCGQVEVYNKAQLLAEKNFSPAEISLVKVIRNYKQIIIVDESHHSMTNLSVEMLKNFNPSFILELTTTQKKKFKCYLLCPCRKIKICRLNCL